jgi:hypothetical protein
MAPAFFFWPRPFPILGTPTAARSRPGPTLRRRASVNEWRERPPFATSLGVKLLRLWLASKA